jgi:hypothetical protein
METGTGYTAVLNKGLRVFFSEFVRVSLSRPSQALFFSRTVGWQRRAAGLRGRYAREGLHVPPIVIFSITNRCNLHCKGCYAQAIRGDRPAALCGSAVRSPPRAVPMNMSATIKRSERTAAMPPIVRSPRVLIMAGFSFYAFALE